MVWLHGGAFSYGSANSPRYDGTSWRGATTSWWWRSTTASTSSAISTCRRLGGERSPSRAMSACSTWSRRCNGCASTPRASAAIPATSRSSASRAAAERSARCWRCRRRKGLFHKAIVQSGATVRFAERERTTRLAEAVLKHLGLGRDQLDALQDVPVDKLRRRSRRAEDAAATALAAARPLQFRTGGRRSVLPATVRSRCARAVRRHPDHGRRHQGRERRSSSRPTTRCGTAPHRGRSAQRIAAVAGARPTRVLGLLQEARSGASPTDRLITALTASNFGVRTVMQAERRRARQGTGLHVLGSIGRRRPMTAG